MAPLYANGILLTTQLTRSTYDLVRCLIDLQNKPHERTLMKKLKKIPGSLRMKAQELKPKDHCPHTLTPTLLQVRPWVERDALLTLEVREFPPRPIFRPHRDYHHDLYIYPRAVTFEKYRNIAVKVMSAIFECSVRLLTECGNDLPGPSVCWCCR